jgi:hypothetical protein
MKLVLGEPQKWNRAESESDGELRALRGGARKQGSGEDHVDPLPK